MNSVRQLFKTPSIKDLVPGSTVSIYKDYKNENDKEGEAVIIEYFPSPHFEEYLYVRHEYDSDKKKDPVCILWSYTRYKVKFVGGSNDGFVTARYIAYFHSVKSNARSIEISKLRPHNKHELQNNND